MGFRTKIGSALESTLGHSRTNAIRAAERSGRAALARRLAPTGSSTPAAAPARGRGGQKWGPPDPQVPHPAPTMTRHELLAGLHERLRPRTYLEVGVADGGSMTLARCRAIGVDPAFSIVRELRCDLELVRRTSDDFFASEHAVDHFGGVPVDLAFIDGLHLAEFALRDFINTEPLMARTGVVVFDDMLPRNPLEAARTRRTGAWAGDVYKAVEVLLRRRPDLVVLLVNTAPTGTAVVVGLDPASSVLPDSYPEEEPYLLRGDPQSPPQAFMDRSIAVDPHDLLGSPVWDELVTRRDADDTGDLTALLQTLRATPA